MASKHCTANNLQNIYVRIGRKLKKDNKIPPLRFGKYKDFSKFEPINEDWENRFRQLWDEVERIDGEEKPDMEDYKNLFRACKKMKGIGPLSANHMLAIASIVGIIPLNMFNFVMEGAAEGMQKIRSRFRDLPTEDEVVANIRYLCENETGEKITSMRGGENVVCKVGRIVSDTDKKFWDVWETNFLTYEVVNGKKIVFGEGKECRGPLLSNKDGKWIKNCEFEVLSTNSDTWMHEYI